MNVESHKIKEVANYSNISNYFKVDYLESTFTDLSSYQRDMCYYNAWNLIHERDCNNLSI